MDLSILFPFTFKTGMDALNQALVHFFLCASRNPRTRTTAICRFATDGSCNGKIWDQFFYIFSLTKWRPIRCVCFLAWFWVDSRPPISRKVAAAWNGHYGPSVPVFEILWENLTCLGVTPNSYRMFGDLNNHEPEILGERVWARFRTLVLHVRDI